MWILLLLYSDCPSSQVFTENSILDILVLTNDTTVSYKVYWITYFRVSCQLWNVNWLHFTLLEISMAVIYRLHEVLKGYRFWN